MLKFSRKSLDCMLDSIVNIYGLVECVRHVGNVCRSNRFMKSRDEGKPYQLIVLKNSKESRCCT